MVASDDLPLEPEFIDDIGAFFEAHVTPEKSVDAVLNEMREKLQQYSLAENRALNRHQTLSQQEVHLKKSLDCVMMLTAKKETEDDTVVDYALGGAIFLHRNADIPCQLQFLINLHVQPTYSQRRRYHPQVGSVSGLGLRLWSSMTWTRLKKCSRPISRNVESQSVGFMKSGPR